MATQIIDLGKIRWSWQGDWSSSTEYELNDVVRYGGNMYIYVSEVPTTNQTPISNPSYWSLSFSGLKFAGTYNNSTTYKPGEVVVYGAASFVCLAVSSGNTPTPGTFWELVSDGIQYKGAYNAVTSYLKRDVVRYGGSAYIAKLNGAGNVPTDTTYWDVLVEGYPDVTSHAGEVLTTDGTSVSWTDTLTLDTLTVQTEFTSEGSTYVGANAAAYETSAALTDAAMVIDIDGGASSFAQIAFHNSEPTSSTDIIAYGSNGTDSFGWVGVGITGDKFDDTTYGITAQGDAYLFSQAFEASATKSVTNKALDSNVATLTSTAHGFEVGQRVVVAGVDSTFNGAFTITAKTNDTFSYAKTYVGTIASTPVSPAGTAKIQSKGNLVIATGDAGADNSIVFAAGGYASGNSQMIIIPDEQVHIEIATASTSPTTGALRVAGGVGITGDTYTDGNVILDGVLYVGPDAPAFETSAGLTAAAQVTTITGGASSFAQMAFTNKTATSSTDIIAYMDNGNDSEGWVGMGITGSQFDDTTYGITGPGDAYIFHETVAGTLAPDYTGNLVIATGANGSENKIVFAAGGFSSGTTQMEITPGVNVHIEIPTPSTSPTTGALTVVGGVGIQGDMNVQGNVAIEGTITFGGSGTTVETSNLAVTDPFVFVGTNNQADIVDLAFIGEYATAIPVPITSNITNKALTSNVATLTTGSAHTFLPGDVVTITGVDATFNGIFNIKETPTATTFTYAKTAGNVSSTVVGLGASAEVNARRKFSGVARDASDGVIKFFKDATAKPTSTINFSEVGLSYADIRVLGITATGTVSLPSTTGIGSVTGTEISYLAGATSSIQTQINSKANSAGPTFTGTVVLPSTTSIGNVSDTEIGYLDGVTSSIQTQIDSKLNTSTAASTYLTQSSAASTYAPLTGGSLTRPVMNSALETIAISATSATGTMNVDLASQSVFYWTSNANANWTFNFRGNSGTTLNSLLATGQSITVAVLVTNGATAYYPTAIQVDGVAVTTGAGTLKWQGGATPTSGNSSSVDSYAFSIIKTGNAAFTVIAAQTRYA